MNEGLALVSIVALVSIIVFVRISSVASILSRQESKTSRKIAIMMYCTCAEILLATLAVFFVRMLWVWMLMKVVGRLIELIGVESFQQYLYKMRNGNGKQPQVKSDESLHK
jgi:NhaP-type Na+/H+ or K+/H+ antiporter